MIKQYEKKDGTKWWYFKAYLGVDSVTGKRIYTTRRGFKTKKEAKYALAALELEAKNNKYRPEKNYTFDQVKDLWLKQYKDTVRETTFIRVNFLFDKTISKDFGSKKIQTIRVTYCQEVANKWKQDHSVYKQLKSYTSKVFDHAIKLNILTNNPMKEVEFSKGERTKKNKERIKFYEKEELQDFLEVCKKDRFPLTFPLFRLLGFSGIRKGEILALTWKDIDFNTKMLDVNKTLVRNSKNELVVTDPKTDNSIRKISLDDITLGILKKWRLDQRKYLLSFGINSIKPDQIVFSSQNNNYIDLTRPNRILSRLCKKNGFNDITIHGFRHTHCSLLFEAGLSIKQVQERLGHKDIQTTMNIYAHVTKKQKDIAAEKFSTYMNF